MDILSAANVVPLNAPVSFEKTLLIVILPTADLQSVGKKLGPVKLFGQRTGVQSLDQIDLGIHAYGLHRIESRPNHGQIRVRVRLLNKLGNFGPVQL